MKARECKRILALALAGTLSVGGIGVPQSTVKAAEILMNEETMTSRAASMEEGMSYQQSDFGINFNGTNVYTTSEQDAKALSDNVKNAGALEISITFKVAGAATNYINLLEIYDSANNAHGASAAQSALGVIVSKTGVVYLEAGNFATGTDWQLPTGKGIADGAFHTLKLKLSADKFTAQMDGGEVKETSAAGQKNTKSYVEAFFGKSGTPYQDWRTKINAVAIGGLSADSYFKNAAYSNLNGEVSAVTIAGKNDAPDLVGSGIQSIMFAEKALDNSWMFGGGIEAQGRFAEVAGARNYVGQFEEYVRWVKRVNGVLEGMQRYTVNVGAKGQDAVAFAEHLDENLAKVSPLAVSYLVGKEDYSKGEENLEAFKEAISNILNAALAMKEARGCAVIQLPHAVKDADTNAKIEKYIAAVREIVGKRAASEQERIAVVDHYSLTKDQGTFLNDMLTDEGLLNEKGHLEIAKQLADAVYGSHAGMLQEITETWTAKEAPETYLDVCPSATALEDGLEVTVPEEAPGDEWSYTLTIDGMQMTGKAFGNPFVIEDLPEGKTYQLTVRTADGKTQLETVTGMRKEGDAASVQALTELQKIIRDKAEDTDTPLTWLFMGDSITHAAEHTHGYDGIAQLFEKYVKEDLGRTNDVVVNTAVSGATAIRTLANIEQRMEKYKPDIVSIMLGTNDSINANDYNAKMKEIVAAIRIANPEAAIIFRTPTPARDGGWASKIPGENGSVASMKKVAQECGNILVIDQYTEWNKELQAYPYLWDTKFYYGDGMKVHPGAAGHVRMTRQFIEETGLNTNTRIGQLEYQFPYKEETSDAAPNVAVMSPDGVSLARSDLQNAYGNSEILGDVTLTLTDKDGRSYTKSMDSEESEIVMEGLASSRRYTATVSALVKGNTAKRVSFRATTILLETGKEKEELQAEAQEQRGLYEDEKQQELYTDETLRVFYEAYEAAARALEANETDAEVLNGLLKELNRSVRALQKVDVTQKNALEAEIDQLAAVYAKGANDYKPESFAKFRAAYEAAVKAMGSGSKDPKQYQEALEALQASYKALERKPNDFGIDDPIIIIKEGASYEVKGYSYKVLSLQKQTVEVEGIKGSASAKIVIPNSIMLGGKTFQVLSIGANAFKNNKKAAALTVGKYVERIGNGAFLGCAKLKKAAIKSTKLKQIGAKAFSGCKKLKTITIQSKSLKKVGKNTFKGIYKKAVIKVPKAKYKKYVKLLAKKGQSKSVKIKK